MTAPADDIGDPLTLIATLRAERDAALAGQSALAEVMDLINRSPGDPAPAFDAVLNAVLRLFDAAFGALHTYDGALVRTVAVRGGAPDATLQGFPIDPGSLMHRIVLGEDIASLADVRDDDAYRNGVPSRVRAADVHGVRTQLMAGLRKDGKLLGFINIFRTEVRPFTEAQLVLVKAFAAQAVIAMENARLITEQREALERQTATAEVLGVINASPGDLTPVFQTMLDRALQLCGASFGEIGTFDGDVFTTAAVSGMPAEFSRLRMNVQQRPGPGTSSWLLRRGDNVVQITDLMDTETYRDGEPARRDLVEVGGARALLSVALRKDHALLGQIGIFRREPGPFSDRQIACCRTSPPGR